MFETSSEQQSKSSVIVVSNTTPASNIIASGVPAGVVVDGAISALNEALVDAIDSRHHHLHNGNTHINMLSASYYYCTNLLDFKHHFNQNFNLSSYSLMPTPSVIQTQTTTGLVPTAASSTSSMATSSTQLGSKPISSDLDSSPSLTSNLLNDNSKNSINQSDLEINDVNVDQTECVEFSSHKYIVKSQSYSENSTNIKTNITISSNSESSSHLNSDLISSALAHSSDNNNEQVCSSSRPTRFRTKNQQLRSFKRTQTSSKRLNSSSGSSQQKKLTNLNKLKTILFKTYRNFTTRNNRFRYSRNRSFNKSSSLSPTSPSSSSSSSSSCSNSPELIQNPGVSEKKHKQSPSSSFKLNTYKRFKKIRNKLLKSNITELINEENSNEEDQVNTNDTENVKYHLNESNTSEDNVEPMNKQKKECQINHEHIYSNNPTESNENHEFDTTNNVKNTNTNSSSHDNTASSLITLQSSASELAATKSHYQQSTESYTTTNIEPKNIPANATTPRNSTTPNQNFNNQNVYQQQFAYDVEMMPQQNQFMLDEHEVNDTNVNQSFMNSFNTNNTLNTSSNQLQQQPRLEASALQQCQIKQDLLKLSYEKFKQFRLNEKLLQQTVLIRNAIKMLQYDIQFQQEQEQIILQQQQLSHQHQQSLESHNACLGYNLNESYQIDVMHQQSANSSPAPTECSSSYLSTSLASTNLISSSPLPSPSSSPSPFSSLFPSQSSSANQSQIATSSCQYHDNSLYPHNQSVLNSSQKASTSPMISAAYENFEEFINNDILNLNQKNSIFFNQSDDSAYVDHVSKEHNTDTNTDSNAMKNSDNEELDIEREFDDEDDEEFEGSEDEEMEDDEDEVISNKTTNSMFNIDNKANQVPDNMNLNSNKQIDENTNENDKLVTSISIDIIASETTDLIISSDSTTHNTTKTTAMLMTSNDN